MELDYAGDLTPNEVWQMLKDDENCHLIDCRSSAEWLIIILLKV